MRELLLRYQKRHIWLLCVLLILAAYFGLRGNKALMNAVADHVTTPFKSGMARLCSLTEVSVAEVIYITLGSLAIFYTANFLRALFTQPQKGETVYRFLLTAVCVGLTFYAGFCLLWGINYHTDSFQDRIGIHARQGTVEEVRLLTERFAAELTAAAGTVPGTPTAPSAPIAGRSSAPDPPCMKTPTTPSPPCAGRTWPPRPSPARAS